MRSGHREEIPGAPNCVNACNLRSSPKHPTGATEGGLLAADRGDTDVFNAKQPHFALTQALRPPDDLGLQVPAAAKRQENREGGANPPRAQRCKEDDPGSMPLVEAGKAPGSNESKPEDRPENFTTLHGQAAHLFSSQGKP